MQDQLVAGLVPAAAAGALFWGAFAALRKARWMANTPTSRIASAAQGFVEIAGRAEPAPGVAVLASPLTGTPCLWWAFTVEERRRVKNRTEWRTVESGTAQNCRWRVRDASGAVDLYADGAEVSPRHENSWRRGERRYTERLLVVGDACLVLGWLDAGGGAGPGPGPGGSGPVRVARLGCPPSSARRPFLVSGHSEAATLRRFRVSAALMFLGSIGCAVWALLVLNGYGR